MKAEELPRFRIRSTICTILFYSAQIICRNCLIELFDPIVNVHYQYMLIKIYSLFPKNLFGTASLF